LSEYIIQKSIETIKTFQADLKSFAFIIKNKNGLIEHYLRGIIAHDFRLNA
jgi:hypothetical protein